MMAIMVMLVAVFMVIVCWLVAIESRLGGVEAIVKRIEQGKVVVGGGWRNVTHVDKDAGSPDYDIDY